MLVSEDVALRRSMIDNPDARTHPLLDGRYDCQRAGLLLISSQRYNAVSYAAGRELRRGGSGVRPEPAKAKSLPPPDTKASKVRDEKEQEKEEAPALTKAKTAIAAALTVREGVKSTAQVRSLPAQYHFLPYAFV